MPLPPAVWNVHVVGAMGYRQNLSATLSRQATTLIEIEAYLNFQSFLKRHLTFLCISMAEIFEPFRRIVLNFVLDNRISGTSLGRLMAMTRRLLRPMITIKMRDKAAAIGWSRG
jgi:hypothetical protein